MSKHSLHHHTWITTNIILSTQLSRLPSPLYAPYSLSLRELRSELTTYDATVVRQLCSGVFEGNNDTKNDGSNDDDGKNDGENFTSSRTNYNSNDNVNDNGGTLAYGNAHNGITCPLIIPYPILLHETTF